MAIKKRFIFLDVDGVLNHHDWYTHLYETHPMSYIRNMDMGDFHMCPDTVRLLNQLHGCEVVISSSWGYCDHTVDSLRRNGLRLPVIGGIRHRSLAEDWLTRGNDIFAWFTDNSLPIPKDYLFKEDGWYHPDARYAGSVGDFASDLERMEEPEDAMWMTYVIFDDDTDMLLTQQDHFIQTNVEHGLTQDHIDRAKKILNIDC